MSPTGESALVVLTFVLGLGWTLYWAGATPDGLFAGWDPQLLSFFFGMAMVTLMIMGIVYLKWVMPDIVIVKHRRNKYMSQKDPESWYDYKV
ncbi:MAG: hypothetical protein MK233_02815, partial [Candidatus Poseidoniales archaeon]|nr:hypothetical protein [Candidatus Poseidoniales archaeon]